MLAGDTAELRKARGAFFTPPELCDYVARWAVRSVNDQVLEPSCGEAAFLLAAGARLNDLRDDLLISAGRLHGIELHQGSAQLAQQLLAEAGFEGSVAVGDFLDTEARPVWDAVVGNPPYVRYQGWSGDDRLRARAAALRGGVNLTNLASSWAAFVVHSSLFLRKGGRLGLVLPAELLTVNYAAEVRSFLMRRFGRVRLVLFEERVFPGVLEEVVLLLADGNGPTDHCELMQVRNLDDLAGTEKSSLRWSPIPAAGKWTPGLIPADAAESFVRLTTTGDAFTQLTAWGETTLGMVTGRNGFFAVNAQTVREWGLPPAELLKLSPPGSRHLRGLSFTESSWNEKREAGASAWLFRPSTEPSESAVKYIAHGKELKVHETFKCSHRRPWWRVPYLKPADLFVTCMNADTPRFCANRAKAHHLNSVHGLYVGDGLRRLALDLLPLASLNTLTVLGAEVTGRAYGGGMLKLEPREADVLPIPSPKLLRELSPKLRALRPQLGTALRQGCIDEAIRLVDQVVLVEGLGMKRNELKKLVGAREALAQRRTSRGAAPRGGN